MPVLYIAWLSDSRGQPHTGNCQLDAATLPSASSKACAPAVGPLLTCKALSSARSCVPQPASYITLSFALAPPCPPPALDSRPAISNLSPITALPIGAGSARCLHKLHFDTQEAARVPAPCSPTTPPCDHAFGSDAHVCGTAVLQL